MGKTCDTCAAFLTTRSNANTPAINRCRLNPPVPISQYTAEYPPIRPGNPACLQYVPMLKRKPKKATSPWPVAEKANVN